jgi:hypothetical protein
VALTAFHDEQGHEAKQGQQQAAPQPSLFDVAPRFDGAVFDPAFDQDRLTSQIQRVYAAMVGGGWRTLRELAQLTGDPESSCSAQLRHLRKPRFGSYVIAKRPRGNRLEGLWEYSLLEPSDAR